MKNRSETLKLFAILCFPWIMVAGSSVLTAINDMMLDYPGIPGSTIYLISTISFLTTIISSLLAGAFAGKHGSYKLWLIISGIGIVVTGILPCFIKNFYLILFVRALYGFAMGTVSPITSAVIFNVYSGEHRTKVLGWHSVSQYISAVVYVMLCGALCAVHWRYSFLIHFVALIPIAFVWKYLPDIKPAEKEKADSHKSKLADALPVRAILYILLTTVTYIVSYPMSLNISVILSEANLGGAFVSGVVLSCSTVGGALAGMVFSPIYRKLKEYSLPLSLIVNGFGIFLVWASTNLAILIIGTIIAGAGGAWLALATLSNVGTFLPNSEIAMFSGVNMAIGSIGIFLAGNYIDFLGKLGFTTAKAPLLVSFIAFGIITVIAVICETIFRKNKNNRLII